jgi:hypothetical protein
MRVSITIILLALSVVVAPMVSAHTAGPCNESGEAGNSDYARHHVRPMAQSGDVGATDHDGDGMSHTPGTHAGYSACDPSG